VGEGAVADGARNDHSTYAESGDGKCTCTIGPPGDDQTPLEHVGQGLEDRLECLPDDGIAAANVAGQSGQRAAPVEIVEMLGGEVGPGHALRGLYVWGRVRRVGSLDLAQPRHCLEAERHGFRIELGLRLEVAIETAVRKTSIGHDLIDRYTLEAVPIEEG